MQSFLDFGLKLSLYSARAVAAGELFYLAYAYTVIVALYCVLKSGCRYCEFNGFLGGLSGEK